MHCCCFFVCLFICFFFLSLKEQDEQNSFSEEMKDKLIYIAQVRYFAINYYIDFIRHILCLVFAAFMLYQL